jgi:hypothetical protein
MNPLFFHRRPLPKEAHPQLEAGHMHQLVMANIHAIEQRIAKIRGNLRLLAFFAGLLLIALIIPTSPVRHALGYGGGAGLVNPTCGQPAQVFAKLLKGETYTLPTKVQLERLPTPKQHPIALASDANYDPATNRLCAGGWIALDTRFVHPSSTVQGSTTYDPNSGFTSTFVANALSGLWTSFEHWLGDSLESLLRDVETLGFLFATPSGLTYQNVVVLHLQAWFLVLTDAALSLFLVIAGYRYLFGATSSLREFASAVLVAAVVANFGLPVLGQFIDLSNAVCQGIQGVFLTAGFGNLTALFELLNWRTMPDYVILVYLIELLCLALLSGQMLLRVAFLCLLLVVAPAGLFLCYGGGFILPGAQQWGTLWAQAFVATLIAQPLQIICLGLGAALVASFGVSTSSPVVPLVSIATIFLAWKIPDLLLSSVIRSRLLSSESAHEMTQNVVNVVQTGTEMAALVAA